MLLALTLQAFFSELLEPISKLLILKSAVIPAKAGIQKRLKSTGFPFSRE